MFAALSLAPSAQAHYIWLERDGEGPARAYFGEWIDDVREKTGISGNEKFNRTRHISSLSFVQQSSIPWSEKRQPIRSAGERWKH